MLPPFSLNQYSKYFGTALGLCLSFSLFAQTQPTVVVPKNTSYPGIIESFEKLIQVDNTRFAKKSELLTKSRLTVLDPAPDSIVDLDVDFINSLILHSDPGYLKLASSTKCHFYDSLINDLLRTTEGRVSNMIVNYTDKKGAKTQALVNKKEFINKIVSQECPETPKLIDQFQLKNIDSIIRTANFETPTAETCHAIHIEWINNPKTPYFCKIHEFMKEARFNQGDPKDLAQRKAVAQALEKKISVTNRDYLESVCTNIDDRAAFCDEFVNVSFWTKVSQSPDKKIFAQDICAGISGTSNLSDALLKQCLSKLKKDPNLCLYPGGRNRGLVPQPQCDNLSNALNHSTLKADYQDCPSTSDQQGVTNLGRVLLNISQDKVPTPNGPCSTVSSEVVFDFNKRFNNDENWKLEACFEDKMAQKEKCYKTYFGASATGREAYNNVVVEILKETRGADPAVKCEMVDSEDYNSLLLQYKSGCYIIYDRSKCFTSQCKHKILYNDRTIDFIKLRNTVTLDYFPTSVKDERFSQHYLLTKDYRREGRTLQNLTTINSFFKKNRKGIIHGIGCAEDLLPSFFRVRGMNQCTALPFIIDGMIKENSKYAFVTRTGADSLQAPRIISWSNVYSSVKTYQKIHPLRIWTLYGLD